MSPAGPLYWPLNTTRGPLGIASRWNTDENRSVARGCHACHASNAALACDHGHDMNTHVAARGIGCIRNLKQVTTPKFPPPPPRIAQNRSGLLVRDTWRTHPSAVMISAPTRLSSVSPKARPAGPLPPPIVLPPLPPHGHRPAGTAAARERGG